MSRSGASGAEELADEIALAFADRRPALSHLLLASLPVREAATTTYDQLFEEAYRNARGGLAIIPDTPTVAREGWLLKMHGCVSDPSSIVLTREDYLRYSDRRAALAGIVQALLITRHMLFVGFSLRDDNFHADRARRQERGRRRRRARTFGTALLLQEESMQRDLWEDDLNLIAIDGTPADPAALPDPGPAWMLEVFLDRLGYEATTSAVHLLDLSYEGVLTREELRVRALLEPLERAAIDESQAPAWSQVRRLLSEMGSCASPDRPGP